MPSAVGFSAGTGKRLPLPSMSVSSRISTFDGHHTPATRLRYRFEETGDDTASQLGEGVVQVHRSS
jgi:hypothetical protein